MAGAAERRFLVVAGEPSGDAHAARLIDGLHARGPCQVRGVAGPALSAVGVARVADMADLSVVGFSGVIGRLPRIWRAYRRMLREAQAFRPDAAILVDSPGFNFRLGPALQARGTRVFYYIAPQVWAWHAERAAEMSRWVERLAVVFPFEERLFKEAGVTTRFVGHPLLDGFEPELPEAAFRAELGITEAPMLGLLPGSRLTELKHHLATMLEAARALKREREGLEIVVPVAPGLTPKQLRGAGLSMSQTRHEGGHMMAKTSDGVHIVSGRTRCVQAYARACAVSSGTATLETALFGTPLVIIYASGRINYEIARRVVKLDRIGLPNIVAGADVAPELIQAEFTPQRLTAALAPLLDDPDVQRARRAQLGAVREALGEPGASARAAEWLMEMVS